MSKKMKVTMIKYFNEFALVLFLFVLFACEKPPTEPKENEDKAPPSVQITFPANNAKINNPINIQAVAVDNNKIKCVTFFVDGDSIGIDDSSPYEQFWNVIYWADDKMHEISAKAIDMSGNIGESSKIFVLISSEALYNFSLLHPANNELITNTNEIRLVWQSLKNVLKYDIHVASDSLFSSLIFSNTTSDTAIITSPLEDGTYYWRVRPQNNLGRTGYWSETWKFRIEKTAFRKIFKGGGSDVGYCVIQSNDGGYVVCGQYQPKSSPNQVWLIKTNSEGEEEWNQKFNGVNGGTGRSVQQTSDGGYIITGATGRVTYGNTDILLIKTDANGLEQWTKTFGGSSYDYGYAVQQTTDEGYIIVGNFWFPQSDNIDLLLIKTDMDGNEQWQKLYGGNKREAGFSINKCSDGGFIIGGYTETYGAGGISYWIIKTNAEGDEEWNKVLGLGQASSVRQTEDKGFISVGSAGYGLSRLVKIDSNGNPKWEKQFEGYAESVDQTNDGGYIITGSIDKGKDGTDVLLIKTDANGNLEMKKTYDFSHFDYGTNVKYTADGGYIITGESAPYGTSGSDVFLIKIDP